MPDVTISEAEKFVGELEERISKRRKEITSLNLGVAGLRDPQTKSAFMRAGVALLYAHWEGTVKESTLLFLKFLDREGADLTSLKENYIVLLNPDGIEISIADAIKGARDKENLLEGSISPKALRRICWRLSLDYGAFSPMEGFIERILRLRNRIVHGEGGQIGYQDFVEMAAQIQELIGDIQHQFAQSVSVGSYIRVAGLIPRPT